MLVTDTAALGEPRLTRDGYMVVDARVARTGIQVYAGAEMDRPDLATVRVYRPADEVFDRDAMGSFTHRPVTLDHPSDLVTAATWKDVAVGQTGDQVARDGEFLRIPFSIMDKAVIDAVQGGKRELSCGYVCDIDWTAGTTPEGEAFDASQVRIRGNHLAIVDRGRAGASCRIGDSWTTSHTRKETNMPGTRTVLVDGISIETTDQGAQVIERLQSQIADTASKMTAKDGQIAALTASHTAALSAKDGEIAALQASHTTALAAKDGEVAAAKALVPDVAAMDAMIEQRLNVVAAAKRALGDSFDPKGKTVADIQAAVVTKRLGDAAVAGKEPAFFAAAFETLALADAGTRPADPVRGLIADGLKPQPPVTANDADAAWNKYRSGLESAWRGAGAKENV